MSTSLGSYLAFLRQARCLSQRQLAKQLGVRAGYLSQLERGHRQYLGQEMVSRMESALKLTDQELIHLNLLRDLSKGVLVLPPDTSAEVAELAGLIARVAAPLSVEQIAALRSLIETLDVAYPHLGGAREQHI